MSHMYIIDAENHPKKPYGAVIVSEEGIVTSSAPIFKQTRGHRIEKVKIYCESRGWKFFKYATTLEKAFKEQELLS